MTTPDQIFAAESEAIEKIMTVLAPLEPWQRTFVLHKATAQIQPIRQLSGLWIDDQKLALRIAQKKKRRKPIIYGKNEEKEPNYKRPL